MVVTVVHGATVTAGRGDTAPSVEDTYAKPQPAPQLASAKAFLVARPLGVYTCARALPSEAAYRVTLWPFHLTRLARGLLSESGDNVASEGMLEMLRANTTRLVEAALREAVDEASEEHAMVTVLWSDDSAAVQIDVHICTMPQVKALTSNVLVHGEPRHEPEIKHSRWIADRVPLERHQGSVSASLGMVLHESILSAATDDGDRVLLEGLITNFFVLKDGCVYTAPTDVLAGSSREMVLLACAALDIPVVLEAPRLSEIAAWDAAFLTSAVRIVIPIERVVWRSQGHADGALQSHTLDTVASVLQPLRLKICDLWRSC